MENVPQTNPLKCIFFVIVCAFWSARADSLLDPSAVSARSPLSVNVSPSQSVQLPDSAYARSLAQRAVSQIEQTDEKLRQNGADIHAMNERLKSFDDRIASLQNQKSVALMDMRLGAFCRACHRTRTEIEAAGEDWQEHLNQNSGGVAVPASKEDLDAKAKEFDDKIKAVEAEKAREAPALSTMITQKQQESQMLASKIDSQMNLWRMAITLESDAIRARGQLEDQRSESAIAVAKDARNKIRHQLDQSGLWTDQTRAAAESQEKFWNNYIIQLEQQLDDRQASRLSEGDNASKAADQDYRQIIQSLRSVDTKPFLSPAITATLEHIPLSYGPVSVTFHSDTTGSNPVGIDKMDIEVTAPGLPASTSLKVDTSDPIAIEVNQCFKALDTFEACFGTRTVYGRDGVRTEQTATFKTEAPHPEVKSQPWDEKSDKLLLP